MLQLLQLCRIFFAKLILDGTYCVASVFFYDFFIKRSECISSRGSKKTISEISWVLSLWFIKRDPSPSSSDRHRHDLPFAPLMFVPVQDMGCSIRQWTGSARPGLFQGWKVHRHETNLNIITTPLWPGMAVYAGHFHPRKRVLSALEVVRGLRYWRIWLWIKVISYRML